MSCIDHLNYCGGTCPECQLEVNEFGNTEDALTYCCYPYCGCDGARLCMAENGASQRASRYNVEGMYTSKDPTARLKSVADIIENDTKER